MSTPFIADADRVVEYAPVASTGPFDVPFPVFEASGVDLLVTLDGVEVGGWTASGTTSPGFYGAPNTFILQITFEEPITGALVIEGRRAPRRVSQYDEGRGVPARDHNTELNILTAIAREQWRRQSGIEGSLDLIDEAVASTEADAALALEAREGAEEARDDVFSRYLGELAADPVTRLDGSPLQGGEWYVRPDGTQRVYASDSGTWNNAPSGIDGKDLTGEDSRNAVESKDIPAPVNYIRTAGYATAGDGGGALYKRVGSEPSHPGKVQSADGDWWELAVFVVDAAMFGARGDGSTDDTAALTDLVTYINARGGKATFGPGTFVYDGSALPPITRNTAIIEGAGEFSSGTILRSTSATGNDLRLTGAQHVTVKNVLFWPGVAKTAGWAVAITGGCFKCKLIDVRADYGFNGFLVDGSTECRAVRAALRFMAGSEGLLFTGTDSARSFRLVLDDLKFDNPYPLDYGPVRTWAASTAYSLQDIVRVNGRIWQCVVAGTSGSTSPSTPPNSNADAQFTQNVTDGTVQWRFVHRDDLTWIMQDSYAYSLVIDKAAVINGARGFRQRDIANTGTSYPIWAFVFDLECDHSFFQNVLLDGGEGFFAVVSWFGSSLQEAGVRVASTYRGEVYIGGGTRITYSWFDGVQIAAGPVDVILEGCQIGDNGQASSGVYNGVVIDTNTTRAQIIGNRIGDVVGVSGNPQAHGILINSGVTESIITNNQCAGNVTAGISNGSTSRTNIVENNTPTQRRSRGTLTIPAGNATGAFIHNLGSTPTHVQATPRSDFGSGNRWWVSTVNSTQVVVAIGSTHSGTVTFDITAETGV